MATETKTSTHAYLVPVAMVLIVPAIVGAVAAIALGFASPNIAHADGIEFYPEDDCYYFGNCGGDPIDFYPEEDPYYPPVDDCYYFGDCGGDPIDFYPEEDPYYSPVDDCYYFGDCYEPEPFYEPEPYYEPYDPCYYSYCGSYPVYEPYPVYYEPEPYVIYEYEYVYEHDYDYPPYDYCSNIPGIQSSYADCHTPTHDEDISCELDVSDKRVDEGDEVTLEWEIDGDADYASINHGVGRVDEDGGEEDVEVDRDTTFRLTVRDDDGDEDTCSVTVRVDEENDFSSVDFEGDPVNNPPVVYLSQLPYTGLEDMTPSMIAFWAMLVALLGIGGYFVFVKRSPIRA
ncbi:hypothetical protein L0Y34_01520 [Candidatus Parcubacteria bacterium]|nr:hypothetical protein [Candidatus Parcubacteria bacterium]